MHGRVEEVSYARRDRAPLDADGLRAALVRPGGLWRDTRVVAETGSTNADLAAEAGAGAPEGIVLAAEWQRAGRGRMGRTWTAPPRAGLAFSLLLRPVEVAPARWAWLPLLAGLAAAAGVARTVDVEVRLKWPNDLLVGSRKLAGILAERAGDAVVIGVGLNVTTTAAELPGEAATSLAHEGAPALDRTALLVAILRELEAAYAGWRSARGDADEAGLREEYRGRCATLGRDVRVELPDGRTLTGAAYDIDATGRLLVRTGAGEEAVSAGDVVHVRPSAS